MPDQIAGIKLFCKLWIYLHKNVETTWWFLLEFWADGSLHKQI